MKTTTGVLAALVAVALLASGHGPAGAAIALPRPPGKLPVVAPTPAPAFDDDAPDPAILRVGSKYYAYTTGTTWGNRIGVLVSDRPDRGWRTVTGRRYGSTALPKLPAWQVPDTQWAPGAIHWGGRFVLFYVAKVKATGRYCITVATAPRPEGPFVDTSSGPFICQMRIGGSIDPQPFVDTAGRPWLHWKNNDEFSTAVSRVWAAPLNAAATGLAAAPREVMAKNTQRYPWQTTVDNPQMVYVRGVHYLFYTSGYWGNHTYRVGYAACMGPVGPCTSGPNPILSSYGTVAGPGGGSLVQDRAGAWWMSYHAWSSSCTNYGCGGKRKLHVAPIQFR